MNKTSRKISSTEHAYQIIKNHILSHKLAPGTRLTSRKLAELTGVSIIPVLHALQRLDNEGLIETVPGWGSRVINLDEETIRDKYYLREAIECQVVRILAKKITEPQKNELLNLAREIDKAGAVSPIKNTYWKKEYEFHLTLARFAGSKSLYKEIQKINLFRFFHRSKEGLLLSGSTLPPDHHQKIVQAILTGDPDVAEKAMRNHIHHSSHRIFNNGNEI